MAGLLRAAGHDCAHVYEVGLGGQPDEQIMDLADREHRSRPKALYPRTVRALRGGHGTGQEIAAFTSPAIFFSTRGLHFFSAYDTGHTSPSSRFAASWKPRVE
jgi:Domain of unknown function (DUF5615)